MNRFPQIATPVDTVEFTVRERVAGPDDGGEEGDDDDDSEDDEDADSDEESVVG